MVCQLTFILHLDAVAMEKLMILYASPLLLIIPQVLRSQANPGDILHNISPHNSVLEMLLPIIHEEFFPCFH